MDLPDLVRKACAMDKCTMSDKDHKIYRAIPKPVVSKVQLHPQALALIRDEESVTDTTNDEQDLVES